VVGSRADDSAEDFDEKKQAIEELLSDKVIVPLWKDMSNPSSSVVGEKAFIRDLGECTPQALLSHFPNLDVRNN
jgi:hypothetical protein